jgi:hypothetical protein
LSISAADKSVAFQNSSLIGKLAITLRDAISFPWDGDPNAGLMPNGHGVERGRKSFTSGT